VNPEPEFGTFNPSEAPEVPLEKLELHQVYILHGQRTAMSMNYMGTLWLPHPVTIDTVLAYRFRVPRADWDVFLTRRSDGALQDLKGNRIAVREYRGNDVKGLQ
jgi:hypothetical protein